MVNLRQSDKGRQTLLTEVPEPIFEKSGYVIQVHGAAVIKVGAVAGV